MNLFDHEYSQHSSSGDKLVYLFERIVFDSYFQQPQWWQQRFRSIAPENEKVIYGKSILEEVTGYMAAWCSGQGKTDTPFSSVGPGLECMGTAIAQIGMLWPTVVTHLARIHHVLPRFMACGSRVMRRAVALETAPTPFRHRLVQTSSVST